MSSEGSQKIENKANNQKRRSRQYPRYNFENALAFTRAVDDNGGEQVTKESIAAYIKSPTNSSAFLGRVSSAKQFGLINVEAGRVTVSELANHIFHPVDEESKKQALLKAFQEPQLYRYLIKKFRGKNLPTNETLANILMHDRENGIEKSACSLAAATFIHSALYVGALQNGMLVVPSIEENSNFPDDEVRPRATFSSSIKFSPDRAREMGSTLADHETEEFIFEYEGGIHLSIPRTKVTSEAIMDGELKDVKNRLIEFAKKYLSPRGEG